MKGNFHVQFLGEGVAATSPPYPTLGWATTQVYPARISPLDQSLDGVADSPAAGIAGRVAAGAGWPGRTEILRFRRWAWICHLGPLSRASIG